jgi:hypothetical protein
MTAPPESPTTHNPQAKLDEQEEFGLCGLVVDDKEKGNELVCGLPGVDEILVRNPFGLFVVVLCRTHKDQHRNFYRALNTRQHRHRRTSR